MRDNAGALAIDDCGVLEIVSHPVLVSTGSRGLFQCMECVEYEFFAKDGCNADSTSLGLASFCIEDTTAPTLEMFALDTIVQCDGSGNVGDLMSWLSNQGGAIAVETCSEVIWTNQLLNTVAGCGSTSVQTYEFTARDSCGHEVITTADFIIEDNVAPVWTVIPENIVVDCDGTGNAVDISNWLSTQTALSNVTDDCSGVRIEFQIITTVTPDFCAGQIQTIYQFTAIDSCGNSASQTATFQIRDIAPPNITCPSDITIDCSETSGFSLTGSVSYTHLTLPTKA